MKCFDRLLVSEPDMEARFLILLFFHEKLLILPRLALLMTLSWRSGCSGLFRSPTVQ